MLGARRIFGGAVSALACVAAVAAPPAHAGGAGQRLVTFVARQCPSFADIAANRARNNIQESLQDLGVDSAYSAGDAVQPGVEAAQSPRCTPLPAWRFTMGAGYRSRAVTGPWGALSIVTSPFATGIVTRPSVPLLDSNGTPTGASIAAAVTVALTGQQTQLAATSSSLWAQGGTPADPVLSAEFPDRYAFGALRCSVDVLNGDNVEWISYPTGARHVFCFAYYVTPPPTSGTIVVRKAVDDPAVTASESFRFQGDVSYTPGGTFDLQASGGRPGSVTFYRAGGRTWSWRELDTPGWRRTGLACTSATGASSTATDVATGTVSVQLAAGDTVTCTHTNRPVPPPAGLTIVKRTLDGTGTFDFAVHGPEDRSQSIETLAEDSPVAGEPLQLAAGTYEITETPPRADPAGRWTREAVSCAWRRRRPAPPVTVDLPAGGGAVCSFTNRFVPNGSIEIDKRTEGAAGTVGYVIRPVDDPTRSYEQRATTERAGQVVRAEGDDLSRLPLGTYEIIETGPAVVPGGSWRLESVVCDRVPRGAARGRAIVTLGRATPHARCTFVNRFVADEPELPVPPAVPEEGVVAGASSFGPVADLQITKRASPRVVRQGRTVTYTVQVVNRGPDTARDVVTTEVDAPDVTVTAPIRTSRGTCRRTPPPSRCRLGSLRPGERVTIEVTVPARRVGRARDSVAVVSSTDDPHLADNRADAAVTIVRPAPPRFTG